MSEYKAKLKAWAVDRATEIAKANGGATLDVILKTSDDLVNYAYEPEMEFMHAIKVMQEYLKNATTPEDAMAKIATLEAELGYLKQDIERQAGVAKVEKETSKESIQ